MTREIASSCAIIKHQNSLFSVRESKEKPHFTSSTIDNGNNTVLSILFRYLGERGFKLQLSPSSFHFAQGVYFKLLYNVILTLKRTILEKFRP